MCSHCFWTGPSCLMLKWKSISQQFSHPCTIKDSYFPALHNPMQLISLLWWFCSKCSSTRSFWNAAALPCFSSSFHQEDGEKKRFPLPWRPIDVMSSSVHGKQGVWSQLQACPCQKCYVSCSSTLNLLQKRWFEKLASDTKTMRENNPSMKKYPANKSYSSQRTGVLTEGIENQPKFLILEVWGQPLLILLM